MPKLRVTRQLAWVIAILAAFVTVVSMASLQGQPAAAASTALARAPQAPPSAPGLKPVVRSAVRHDLSAPLRSMRPVRPPKSGKVRVVPVRNPLAGRARHAPYTLTPAPAAGVQRTAGTGSMPAFGQNFEGIDVSGEPLHYVPPDTNMAVGPSDVVQTVNTAVAVWDKSGQQLLAPEDLSTVWQGFGGSSPCDPATDGVQVADGGDPIVMYDEAANRWFISQLSYPALNGLSGGFHECIAVSQTGDPTGAYYRYDFKFSDTELNDYPKFGVWPDAYYQTTNDFSNNFDGVTVTAYDRAAMLAGQQAKVVSFTTSNAYGNLLPANWEGAAQGENPPAGAPEPFVMSCDANTGGPCTSNQIDEWDFHVDWSNPQGGSTFGLNNTGAPNATLPTDDFNGLCGDNDGACISQPGTSQGLDAHSDSLMYQAAYRNIGGTPTLALSQTVNATPSTGSQAGVNWYQLTDGGSGWAIADQGTYAPDSSNRWMPSANIDVSGDLAVGYSLDNATSSPPVYPSIAVAGRLATDPPGQLAQGESTMAAGSGSQTFADNFGRGRWGDYSAMQVDPANGCTFWYTNEYYTTTAKVDWQTRIGSFTYPSCSAVTPGHVTGTVTDAATSQPIGGATVKALGETVTTGADGSYTLILPPGTDQVTVSDYGYQDAIASVAITSGQTTTQDFALTGAPHDTVSGTVTPASGTAWPLYAQVSWGDGNGHKGSTFTDPATGKYSLSLLAGGSYKLTVHVENPGYTDPDAATVSVGTSDVTQDFTAGVDLQACTAIGYHPVLTGTTQPFTGTSAPGGWRVTNTNLHIPNYQFQPGWVFSNPGGRANNTGGAGNFAIVDSANDGQFHYQDTELTSPVMDLSADKTPVVQFATDLEGTNNTTATVDLSVDGGKTWTNAWTSKGSGGIPGPATVVVPVPQAVGKTKVKVRFGYTGQNAKWWELDNAFLGNRACQQQSGGLVVGRVADSSGNGINGATVASAANPAEKVVTVATPGDSAINGGLYELFVGETGSQQFTASATGYSSSTQPATVTAGQVSPLNFTLSSANGGQASSPSRARVAGK